MKTITIYPAKELNSDRLILTRRVFGEQLRDILKSRGKSLEYLESCYDKIIVDINLLTIIFHKIYNFYNVNRYLIKKYNFFIFIYKYTIIF